MRLLLCLVLVGCAGAPAEPEEEEPAAPAPATPAPAIPTPSPARDAEAPASPPPKVPSGLDVQFDPAVSTFTDAVEVKLTAAAGATIHYTLDDKPPTAASPVYRAPLRITAPTVVRAFAESGGASGPVASHSYIKLEADAAAFTSNIPVVLLHSAVPRPLRKADGTKPGIITIFEPIAGRTKLTAVPTLDTRMGIHVRGRTSETREKKSYKVELWSGAADDDQSASVLGMPAESDWVLYGTWSPDKTMMKNALMYALSNQVGRWAPRTRFVELFYTDAGRAVTAADYVGVYVLMEKIKVDKNRLAIHKIDPMDVAEPAVSGGYIFKIDGLNSGERGIGAGFGPNRIWAQKCPANVYGICELGNLANSGTVAFYYPDEATIRKSPAQLKYLTDSINGFSDAIASKQDFTQLIDQGSWIDHHILETYSKNQDALRLSGYYHKDRGGKIGAGPVWDFDISMGDTWVTGHVKDPTWWDGSDVPPGATAMFMYGWWRGLFENAAFKTAYFARWRELIKGPLSAAGVQAVVDRLAAELGTEAPARNFARWKSDAPGSTGHAGEVKRLKDWISRRSTWIDGCLGQPDPMACRGGP